MHNLGMNRKIGKMTFRVKPSKLAACRSVGYPACKKSEKLCRVVSKSYLLPEELKMLELAGYKIDYEETQAVTEPFYTRGVP